MKNGTVISIWRDSASKVIIVSLDDDDDSDTLDACLDHEQAHISAFAEADKRGLPVVREDPEGSGQWKTIYAGGEEA